jgi:copper(I)-binding protein
MKCEDGRRASCACIDEILQLELPAGQTIGLKPGGLHVMMDLAATAQRRQVPFTLVFKMPG